MKRYPEISKIEQYGNNRLDTLYEFSEFLVTEGIMDIANVQRSIHKFLGIDPIAYEKEKQDICSENSFESSNPDCTDVIQW